MEFLGRKVNFPENKSSLTCFFHTYFELSELSMCSHKFKMRGKIEVIAPLKLAGGFFPNS